MLRQGIHQFAFVERVQVADVDAALFYPTNLVGFRLADAQDNVGLRQYIVPVGADRGAGVGVLTIGKAGTLSQRGFDGDVRAELDQFFHRIRDHGYAILTRMSLLKNTNLHKKALWQIRKCQVIKRRGSSPQHPVTGAYMWCVMAGYSRHC